MLQNKQDNKNIPIWFLYVAPLSLFFSMFLPFLYWEQQQRHIVIFTDIAITTNGSVALWTCIISMIQYHKSRTVSEYLYARKWGIISIITELGYLGIIFIVKVIIESTQGKHLSLNIGFLIAGFGIFNLTILVLIIHQKIQ